MMTQATGLTTGERRAIVIGSGMAGLVTARVLADHCAQVTILERDRLPEAVDPRKGVPQGRHLHILLRRGRDILEELFPGLEADLRASGVPVIDYARDLRWLNPAGWGCRFASHLRCPICTRPLLEAHVRARVAAHTRVRLLEASDVVGLLADGRGVVRGVRLRDGTRAAGADGGDELRADLVVDASGRASRAPRWLEALGYPIPEETVVNPFLGYATRLFAPPGDFAAPWRGLYVQTAPPWHLRGGALMPVEDGRWMAVLVGLARDYPPTDEEGFLAFARSLRTPALYDAISQARPLGPVAGYQGTENRLRHYERLPRWPDGFAVVGDAVCAFNPVYGQGMTAAAIGAQVLGDCLREQRRRHPDGDLTGLPRRFQRRLARKNAEVWLLATGEDLRSPATEGGRPGPATRLMHRYLDRVLRRATEDPRATLAVGEVLHLLKPPTVLFHPRILLPALAGARGVALERLGG